MAVASRAVYRARQFFGALRPSVDEQAWQQASALLGDGERRLFLSMTPRDQQHCLAVYRWLADRGESDRELLAAALLHDAGKGRIALWHRVAFVVLHTGAPWLLRRVAVSGDGDGWRQVMYRCLHHEPLGAELARAAGSSPAVCALISANTDDPRLAALKAADEAN
jgi:hypothetical protein